MPKTILEVTNKFNEDLKNLHAAYVADIQAIVGVTGTQPIVQDASDNTPEFVKDAEEEIKEAENNISVKAMTGGIPNTQ
jgi:hypothetical protein